MSDKKWTPGKWRVVSSGRHVVSDDAPGHVVIVRTGLDNSEGDEMPDTVERWEADAHLIAAAPELYEALQVLVRHSEKLGRRSAVYDEARAALSKARGES